MTSLEKTLMLTVPIIGISLIFAFFYSYNSSLNSNNVNKEIKKQLPFVRKNTTKITQYDKSLVPIKRQLKKKVNSQNFIQSGNSRMNISNSFSGNRLARPKSVSKPYDPSIDIAYLADLDIKREAEAQEIYKNRRLANFKNNTIKSASTNQCKHYLKMKEQFRDRMRRKYRASQYDFLEGNRKKWAKLYADNCFNR